jgi:hypothetical protein
MPEEGFCFKDTATIIRRGLTVRRAFIDTFPLLLPL